MSSLFIISGELKINSNQNFKLHDVNIFAVVRVKVSNVSAENHAEAIRKAEGMTDLHQMFRGSDSEFSDDIDCFLVDEVGDEEFTNSRWYEKDGVTPCCRHEESSKLPTPVTDKSLAQPLVTLITLSSGDVGLFLDDRNILTADPQFEPVDQVETAGFNLANALGCDINVVNMVAPAKDDWNWNDVLMLHLNPDLNLYRVSFHEEAGDKTILHFDCFATDPEHAMEQAENAYPGSEILHAAVFEHENPSDPSLRNALEQIRAALPDSSFAKQEGIDPDLIHSINEALASNDIQEAHLKQLFIESREALPVAWKNHGDIPDDLLKLIDGFIFH